jgi:hypothetical protein
VKRLVLSLVVVGTALALAAGVALAQANTVTDSRKVPVDLVAENPCTGELVELTGHFHFVQHVTEDANGGFHVKIHGNFHGQGVSSSGAKYVDHNSSNFQLNFRADSAVTFTRTVSGVMIRQGSAAPADDLVVKFLTRFTINANGEVTAEVLKAKIECK